MIGGGREVEDGANVVGKNIYMWIEVSRLEVVDIHSVLTTIEFDCIELGRPL
jgi:hypothetical protein